MKIKCDEHGERLGIKIAEYDFMCSECYYEAMKESLKNNKLYNKDGTQIKGMRLAPAYTIGPDGTKEFTGMSFVDFKESDEEE